MISMIRIKITQNFFDTFFTAAKQLFYYKIKPDGSLNIDLYQVIAVTTVLGTVISGACSDLEKDLTKEEKSRIVVRGMHMMDFLQHIKDMGCLYSIQVRTMSDEEIAYSLLGGLPNNAIKDYYSYGN